MAVATFTIESVVKDEIERVGGKTDGMTNPIYDDILFRVGFGLVRLEETLERKLDYAEVKTIAESLVEKEFSLF